MAKQANKKNATVKVAEYVNTFEFSGMTYAKKHELSPGGLCLTSKNVGARRERTKKGNSFYDDRITVKMNSLGGIEKMLGIKFPNMVISNREDLKKYYLEVVKIINNSKKCFIWEEALVDGERSAVLRECTSKKDKQKSVRFKAYSSTTTPIISIKVDSGVADISAPYEFKNVQCQLDLVKRSGSSNVKAYVLKTSSLCY